MTPKPNPFLLLLLFTFISYSYSSHYAVNSRGQLNTLECLNSPGAPQVLDFGTRNAIICINNNFHLSNLWSYHKLIFKFNNIADFEIMQRNGHEIDLLFQELNNGEFTGSYQNYFLKHSAHQNAVVSSFISTNQLVLYISPYDNFLHSLLQPSDKLYIALLSQDSHLSIEYSFQSHIFYHAAVLLLSLILFTYAKSLSESIYAYYLIWIVAGMILGILSLIFITIYLSKDRIGVTNMIAVTCLLFFGSFLIISHYLMYVLVFSIVVGGIFGAIMANKFSDNRNSSLTRFSAKVIALIGVFFSFESTLVSLSLMMITFFLQFKFTQQLIHPFLYPIRWLKWNLFPSRRKLISKKEYARLGAIYTKRGIEELVQYVEDDPSVLSNLSDTARDRMAQLLESRDHLQVVLRNTKNIQNNNINNYN